MDVITLLGLANVIFGVFLILYILLFIICRFHLDRVDRDLLLLVLFLTALGELAGGVYVMGGILNFPQDSWTSAIFVSLITHISRTIVLWAAGILMSVKGYKRWKHDRQD